MSNYKLREQILAERFRVSRSPVRDALLRLEMESLVTVLPRQGYLVNAISIPDVEAMFELRLLVTSACAARAARADDAAVRTLERFRSDPDRADDEDLFLEYNRAFHFAIANICGNPRLAWIECDLAQQSSRLIRVSLRHLQNSSMVSSIKEHNEIIDAIQAHDPETASRLSSRHIAARQPEIIAALRKNADAVNIPASPPG